MANIINRNGKWRALVRRKGHPSYCQTFPTKAQAQAWARQIEADIDRGRAPEAKTILGKSYTVSDCIADYRKLRGASRPVSDSSNEHYTLKALDRLLGTLDVTVLQPADLVAFCHARADEGAGPYTCNMDIGKLGTVLRLVGVHKRLNLPDVVGQARPLLAHMNLIGGGGQRERRPDADELTRIIAHIGQRGQLYADVVRFAVGTAMRRGEIVKLMRSDIDSEKRLILVRDRKDPRQKQGNDMWVPLLGEMWDLVQAQPVSLDGRLFPLHEQTISKYFKETCDALGIVDLHFHDLRHHGVSLLFEQGFDIPRVAMVSGHKSWSNLKRYVNLRPEDLHSHVAGQSTKPHP
jgi:integrase